MSIVLANDTADWAVKAGTGGERRIQVTKTEQRVAGGLRDADRNGKGKSSRVHDRQLSRAGSLANTVGAR